MVEQEIIDLTQIAKSYLIELGSEMIDEQKKGCDDCADKISWKIQQIIMLVESLYEKIRLNDYGEETESLYACLLSAVGSYSGASLSVDPNAVNPNITIIVHIIGNNQPNELTFYWSDFINNGEEGRVRYENPLWVNWTPMLSIGNMPFLEVGIDFEVLPSGGFTLLSSGNVPAIFEGQIVRAVGYEPISTPPQEFTYKLINNSTIDTEYTLESVIHPLTAGQTIENDLIVGEAIGAQVMDGQTCTYTVYKANGDVDYTTTLIGEGFINGISMVDDKSQEFLFFDSDTPPNLWIDTNTWNDTNTWTD